MIENRRSFIKMLGVLGAGLALGVKKAAATPKKWIPKQRYLKEEFQELIKKSSVNVPWAQTIWDFKTQEFLIKKHRSVGLSEYPYSNEIRFRYLGDNGPTSWFRLENKGHHWSKEEIKKLEEKKKPPMPINLI